MRIVRHRDRESRIVRVARDEITSHWPDDRVVVTESRVAAIFPDLCAGAVVVPPGEASKSLAIYGELLEGLAERAVSRQTTVIALGGGVVGDLAGFAAATWMRGVPIIQIPTTLLAQVDSSVGGKTGIDLPMGKNLVGAFHPAETVLLCHDLLAELPPRQIANGLAEIVKYGLIMDAPLLAFLGPGLPSPEVVDRCVELKAGIVEEDEFETTGSRARLNFGHTIGHAIEHALHYDGLLHGEAIAVGMSLEAELGERLGVSPPGTRRRVDEVLHHVGLATTGPRLDPDELLAAMARDKKATKGNLAFALLSEIGACQLVKDVPATTIREVLAG